MLVFKAGNTASNIDHVFEEILDYQVDGIIAASVSVSSDLAQRCRGAGVPIVFFNRTQEGHSYSAVTSDNHAGGRRVAEFLVAGGHERIGYVAGWEGASTQRDREAGAYYDRMFQAAVDVAPEIVSITSFNEWHEGTQIEPAVPKTIPGYTYLDYTPRAPHYYLDRTRHWVDKFQAATRAKGKSRTEK